MAGSAAFMRAGASTTVVPRERPSGACELEISVAVFGRGVRREDCPIDDRAIRCQRADGIRAGGIAGQRKRLAAAAAEVHVLARARATWRFHPTVASKRLERRGLFPDPAERSVAYAVETQRA